MKEVYEPPPNSALLDVQARLGELLMKLEGERRSLEERIGVDSRRPRMDNRSEIGKTISQIVWIPRMLAELERMSLGYMEKDSADISGRTHWEVKNGRKMIRRDLRARNRAHTVAIAIENGIIPIRLETEPEHSPLSEIEETCLKLSALGYSMPEIGEICGISSDTVDTHLGNTHQKLSARNLPHSVRRAFETGIFKLGEELGDTIDLERAKKLKLHIGDKVLSAEEAGIVHPAQLTLLDNIAKLGKSSFYFNEITSQSDRVTNSGKKYKEGAGLMFFAVRNKLDEACGNTVIHRTKRRVGGGRDYMYYLKIPVSFGEGSSMTEIPAFDEKLLNSPTPKKEKKPSPKPKPVRAAPKLKSVPSPKPKTKVIEALKVVEEPRYLGKSQESIDFWRRLTDDVNRGKWVSGF